MNSIVKEISEKSKEYAKYECAKSENQFKNYQDVFESKFAELIIKNCLSECYTTSSSDVVELAVQQVYERIKKKFELK